MDYHSLIYKLQEISPYFYTKLLNNSIIIIGSAVMVFLIVVYKIKRNANKEQTIIETAQNKSVIEQMDGEIIPIKKFRKAKAFAATDNGTHKQKKYVLVPKDEWDEYQKLKREKESLSEINKTGASE